MRAIGDNDKVERTMPASRLVNHRRAPAIVLDVDDFGTGNQMRGRVLQSLIQQPEQRTTMDAQPVRCLVQFSVGKIENNMPAVVQSEEAIDSGAQPLDPIAKIEAAQHRQAGGLQQQASAGRPRLDEALEDGNAMPGVSQKRRSRLAGYSTAGYSDFEHSHRGQRPPLTTRHWPLT